MKIPFSPPIINENVIAEVNHTLHSGWITSGPKVKELEMTLAHQIGTSHVVCVNSWSSGAMLLLKWLGIGEGDEVIVPAYTYCATALSVIHCGATPVIVDVKDDFTIDPEKIAEVINENTKAIFAVDFGGLMCDYDTIYEVINRKKAEGVRFNASSAKLAHYNRPLLLSDAAHSIGASYKGKKSGAVADFTIFSLHAVKNITTAEGGAISFNLPDTLKADEVYKEMKLWSLNGQTKDAFSKTNGGGWRYDVLFPGLKVNMPDVCAAIGLAQLRDYEQKYLPERKRIADLYHKYFLQKEWAITPVLNDLKRKSCYHIYPLRIKGLTEDKRDRFIECLMEVGISVNVHFIPLPLLTVFRNLGYDINNYPVSYSLFENEISLPIYPQLSNMEADYICESISMIFEKEFNGFNI
jgi:dTDP-4-amino-4,6-dideoxygalactose transaminase